MAYKLEKISYIEPFLFLVILAANLQGLTRQALIYQKACSNLYTECDFLQSKRTNTPTQKCKRLNVQKLSDNVITINSALMVATPIIAIFLSGLQIDKGRYKQSLCLPLIGSSSGCLFLMFIVRFKFDFWVIYLSTIVSFCFGSVVVLLQTSFSYISVTVNPERLSSRLVIAEVVIIFAVLVTNNVGGYLADLKQLDMAFLISLVLYIASSYYGLFLIPDIPKSSSDGDSLESKPTCNIFKRLFGVIFKKRDSRNLILLYLLCFFISYLTYTSYTSVTYLYFLMDPFLMSNKEYGIAMSIASVGGLIIGTLSSQFLLKGNKSGKSRLSDTSFGILSTLSNSIGLIFLGFAKNKTMIYVAMVFLSFQSIPAAIFRSMLAKLVDPNEKGRLFSVILILQSLTGVLGNTLGLQVYRLTLTTLPGLVFFVLGGLLLTVSFTLMYRRSVERRH